MTMFWFIFHIVFFYISSANARLTNRAMCSKTYNIDKCVYDIECENNINSYNFDEFQNVPMDSAGNRYNDYYNNDDEIHMISSEHCNYFIRSDNGWDCYPIHLKYSYNDPFTTDLRLSLNNIRVLRLVTYLDISGNNIESIPVLSELVNLKLLNVSRNSISVADLSNNLELQSLTEIDLSHNVIKDITYYESSYVYRNLKKIDLSHNYLTKISDAKFNPFNKVEILDLSYNYIDILNPITFEGMRQLVHLNLSHNRIFDINSSLFRFSELKQLDLSHNNIGKINAVDFDKLIKLEILDLSHNIISVIERETFFNTQLLWDLNLNNNELKNIDKDTFSNMMSLQNIDLSQNKLSEIPKSMFKRKRIMEFSIKGNVLEGSLEKGTFDGLAPIKMLDLSNQKLNSINDYAFYGLDNLEELLLNNNNISVLTTQAFMTCRLLQRLDLSRNKILNIEFDKSSLNSLIFLSLKDNQLSIIKQESFFGLQLLQFLDLSDNKITEMETDSFDSLKELINFQISNNPLNGTLQKRTFDGLSSLPSLDISCTSLSTIQNGSFTGMTQLKNLNISHSKIDTLEYNVFNYTGVIEVLDLSHNKLKEFNINSTELNNLNKLYLSNNKIKNLDTFTLQKLVSLSYLVVSHNDMNGLDANALSNLKYLQVLDVSYNPSLNVPFDLIKATKTLDHFDLSGIKTNISFANVENMAAKYLTISNANIVDILPLQLHNFHHLDTLILSFNNITELKVGSFYNISMMRYLDLSHNKIDNIRPGVFVDNGLLVHLNLSHNLLKALPYGIFQGLIYLNTLDISYNDIDELQNERFYEVKSLSVLIADYNKIKSVSVEDFLGTSLSRLSIGGNPIPCDVLVNLKRNGVAFEITASSLYENNEENVHGVTCNRKLSKFDQMAYGNATNADTAATIKVLLNIRDIMLEQYNKEHDANSKAASNVDDKYLMNITKELQTFNADFREKIANFIDFTSQFNKMLINSTQATNEQTNTVLNKILRVLTLNSASKTLPVQVTKENATYENLVTYVNKMKQDLDDTFNLDKDNILNEMNRKIADVKLEKDRQLKGLNAKIEALNSSQNVVLLSSETPKHHKLSASVDSKSLFTETCVGLILVILVGFVLFKVYKSGVFVRRRLSISTRELPGSMDSPL